MKRPIFLSLILLNLCISTSVFSIDDDFFGGLAEEAATEQAETPIEGLDQAVDGLEDQVTDSFQETDEGSESSNTQHKDFSSNIKIKGQVLFEVSEGGVRINGSLFPFSTSKGHNFKILEYKTGVVRFEWSGLNTSGKGAFEGSILRVSRGSGTNRKFFKNQDTPASTYSLKDPDSIDPILRMLPVYGSTMPERTEWAKTPLTQSTGDFSQGLQNLKEQLKQDAAAEARAGKDPEEEYIRYFRLRKHKDAIYERMRDAVRPYFSKFSVSQLLEFIELIPGKYRDRYEQFKALQRQVFYDYVGTHKDSLELSDFVKLGKAFSKALTSGKGGDYYAGLYANYYLHQRPLSPEDIEMLLALEFVDRKGLGSSAVQKIEGDHKKFVDLLNSGSINSDLANDLIKEYYRDNKASITAQTVGDIASAGDFGYSGDSIKTDFVNQYLDDNPNLSLEDRKLLLSRKLPKTIKTRIVRDTIGKGIESGDLSESRELVQAEDDTYADYISFSGKKLNYEQFQLLLTEQEQGNPEGVSDLVTHWASRAEGLNSSQQEALQSKCTDDHCLKAVLGVKRPSKKDANVRETKTYKTYNDQYKKLRKQKVEKVEIAKKIYSEFKNNPPNDTKEFIGGLYMLYRLKISKQNRAALSRRFYQSSKPLSTEDLRIFLNRFSLTGLSDTQLDSFLKGIHERQPEKLSAKELASFCGTIECVRHFQAKF